jgi:hypothetical protein
MLKSIVGTVYDRAYFVDLGRMMGSATPLLIQEGWTRHQEDVAKPPYKGADGVVGPGAQALASAQPLKDATF